MGPTGSTLLTGLFDYAGLFPPAGLSMAAAVAHFARYQADTHRGMLNTFVIPATRLDELPPVAASSDDLPDDSLWRLSVLSADWPADLVCLEKFQLCTTGYEIVSVETRNLSAAAQIRRSFPVYVELPLDDGLADSVALLPQIGAFAKIRMGGLTADAFPGCDAVARFLLLCAQAHVSFKATAGLHHPLRSERPTSTAADAPLAMMHGFVNVLSAVAAVMSGATADEVSAVLKETRAEAFGELMTTPTPRGVRQLFHSIGSCSFEEPVADLQDLLWL